MQEAPSASLPVVTILADNPCSWMVPYARELLADLRQKGHDADLVHSHKDLRGGDILAALSCEKLLRNLSLYKRNIVVHASLLPKGRGWSPLTWQILEGRNDIPLTLFEMTEGMDAGDIYLQDFVHFEGHELIDEMREPMARKINEMVKAFVARYPDIAGLPQDESEATVYRRRGPKDSALDPGATIEEQFNLLRVCDNERYPAYFIRNGYKYSLRVEKTKVQEAPLPRDPLVLQGAR